MKQEQGHRQKGVESRAYVKYGERKMCCYRSRQGFGRFMVKMERQKTWRLEEGAM